MFILHVIRWIQIAALFGYWYIRHSGNKLIFFRKTLHCLRQENILFTKIFQSLANNSNLELSNEFRAELRPYTTNASYTEDEIDYEAIDHVEETYGVRMDRHVANSGMIALIFNGTDSSGNSVILKLKRADIYNRLREGCENVSVFYQWATYWWPRHFIVQALRPFFLNLNDILEQCDFGREIQNMTEAHEDYAELGFVKIPVVRNRPADTEYILMDRIDGTHVMPPETSEEDRLATLFKFCLFVGFGYISNAVQHIDLHAGNVLFMPNGDLGIIDFGLAFRFTDDEHDTLLSLGEIIRGNQELDDVDIIETFKNIFDPPFRLEDVDDPIAFANVCRDIIRPILHHMNTTELVLLDNIESISSLMKREVTMVPHFYKILLGMACMGQLHSIMGRNYENHKMLRDIEMRAINAAFVKVFS
jgi:predicted unusual protein kinase regulating ubiquinone biosynthesis (AarF/ABC1/UbiB family)